MFDFEINPLPQSLFIVDDDAVLRSALQIPLRAYFSVFTSDGFKSAKQILETQKFDIILLDCRLGDGNSLNLISIIKDSAPESIIIMISGESEINTVMQALRLGAVDYVVKDQRLLQEILIRIPMAVARRKLSAEGDLKEIATSNLPSNVSDLTPKKYEEFLAFCEKVYFTRALELSRFEVSSLARSLGLSRSTVHVRLNDLQISRKQPLVSVE